MAKLTYYVNLIIFLVYFLKLVNSRSIFIQTATAGNIKGKIQAVNGKNYGVFLGIPYAKPPIGDLRFKAPQPLDIQLSATMVDANIGFSKKCVQVEFNQFINSLSDQKFHSNSTDDNQSEDCLFLNVMIPKINTTDNITYPVMVWIHGGAFIMGSASGYNVEGTLGNIVSRGVIFVSINYRLGTFGFLTTRSSVAPGNYGLLDQVEALRWVQKNIHFFGGDPDNVTIFGESAGGDSVSILTLSPLTKDLFKQAIIMSGSAFDSSLLMYDSEPDDVSGNVLESLGCRNKTSRDENTSCPYRTIPDHTPSVDMLKQHEMQMDCLRSKNVTEIASLFDAFTEMKPRIDGEFLPESPEILSKKRRPYNLMIGVTSEEMASYQFYAPLTLVQTEEEFKRSAILIDCRTYKYSELVNFTALYHYAHFPTLDKSGLDEKHFWFQQTVKLKSGPMFWVPAYQDALKATKTNSTVYLYSYDWQNAIDFYHPKTKFYWKGASHSSELYSLFDSNVIEVWFRDGNHTRRDKSQDNKSKEVWGKLVTNFAKYGNPTPDASIDNVTWQPFTIKDSNYLSIDMPKIRMAKKFYEDDIEFWISFIPQLEKSVKCG